MLRSIARIRRNPLEFLASVRAEHGGVAQFPIPRPPTYLVSDPEAVRQVLVTNARAYGKRTMQYTTLALVTGDGLLAADTETWRELRPVVQPAFHHSAVARVAGHVGTAVRRLDAQWGAPAASDVVDVEAAMMHLALEVVGRALFGADLTGDAERLAAATVQALDVVVGRVRMPLAAPQWVPTPANLRLSRALRHLDAAVAGVLADRARHPLAPAEPARDMLDLLLAPGALTPTQVRDEIATFIVAGHETVGAALTWAWYLLGRHPQAAARLRAEADAVLPDRDGTLTLADLPRLPYARAVLDETLRLYPPAWLITRRAREPDQLAGIPVPVDALMIMSPWLVHRDAACWSDPEAFDPTRFLPEGPAVPRAAYLPFGAGPRLCIGRDLALLEGVLTLAALARRYELIPLDAHPVRARPMVTIRPADGLRMRALPR